MCYFFSQADEAVKVQKRFQAKLKEGKTFKPIDKVSGFSFPQMPVVIRENENFIDTFAWGLIPSWIKTKEEADKIRSFTLNARAESIFEKPSFKNSVIHKRCLIPTTGFYEWQHLGKKKIPYFITLKNEELFAFGGIWEEWINKATGEISLTFSIITTEANPLMSEIHNSKKRMPFILPLENEFKWLNSNLNSNDIQTLMQPFDASLMIAQKIA